METQKPIRLIDVQGVSYAHVLYFAEKYGKNRIAIIGILDEFDIPSVKIDRTHFYELGYAEVVMEVMNNKVKYLNEIINQKLGERQKTLNLE